MICDVVSARSRKGYHFGVVLLPESLLIAVPQTRQMIHEIEEILEQLLFDQEGDEGGVAGGVVDHTMQHHESANPSVLLASRRNSRNVSGRAFDGDGVGEHIHNVKSGGVGGDGSGREGAGIGGSNTEARGSRASLQATARVADGAAPYTVVDVGSRLKTWTGLLFEALPEGVGCCWRECCVSITQFMVLISMAPVAHGKVNPTEVYGLA